jgi:TRAP-type C4-dicarboxylate transport system permease small subunit
VKIIRLFDRVLTAVVTAVLICAFSLMLGLAFVQVVLRDTLHTGIAWGDGAARQLVIWVGFFGAYLATRSGKHFHVDVLTRFLGPRLRPWFNALSDLFAALICFFLVVASRTFVTVGLDPDATLFLGIPQTAAASIVPAGFGLITVQFLLRTVDGLAAAIRGEPPGQAAE